ncbi:Uncharacterised protein [Mycobacteroides abscessus subsp. abscessus]|nr:Uncharacterised protein [Mycobacteroides abscessus subsp. abscessus]
MRFNPVDGFAFFNGVANPAVSDKKVEEGDAFAVFCTECKLYRIQIMDAFDDMQSGFNRFKFITVCDVDLNAMGQFAGMLGD